MYQFNGAHSPVDWPIPNNDKLRNRPFVLKCNGQYARDSRHRGLIWRAVPLFTTNSVNLFT